MWLCVCMPVHSCALIEEAQGRESTINWATWISHAKLMRLKCVERQHWEGIADHRHSLSLSDTHTHTLRQLHLYTLGFPPLVLTILG